MTTGQNPKGQPANPNKIPGKQGPGGENCAKMEDFNIQIFFGVWTLAFEICPRQRAVT
jgi:hypothetical protein